MTVFKGYLRILKRNLGLVILYIAIFFAIALALQESAQKEIHGSYQQEKTEVGVVDRDGGILAKGLTEYLKSIHHVTLLDGKKENLQENLFYRNVEYIIQIPENFYQTCMVEGKKIAVTKVPGSYTSYYIDAQIENCLNTMKTYLAAGFSQEETAKAIQTPEKPEVTMMDFNGNGGKQPAYIYYFRYVPYLFLAVLCYVMGYILIAFKKEDISRRMQACAVSARRQTLEGMLAMLVMGGGLWGIAMSGAVLLYGKDFLSCKQKGYFLFNGLVMLAVALTLAYLVGIFVKNSNMLSGITNILSLGMCFLCGTFVPMEIMDKKVLKIAQFLPVYWYEKVNETLGEYRQISTSAAVEVWKGIGMQALFALAFISVIMAVTKYHRQQ